MLYAFESAGVQIAVSVSFEGDAKAFAIQSAALSDVVIDRSKPRNEQNDGTHKGESVGNDFVGFPPNF